MLSNTADTKPRPKVVCTEAAGSLSTGIKLAAVTRKIRNRLPLSERTASRQGAGRICAPSRMAAHKQHADQPIRKDWPRDHTVDWMRRGVVGRIIGGAIAAILILV